MNKKVALFNGCSFVWGDELKDPQNSRFSRLISTEANMEEFNISMCGASNSRILRTTLDWVQLNGAPDVMIVVWSGLDRFEYIDLREKDKHDFYFMQCSPSRIEQQEFRRRRPTLERYMTELLNDNKRSLDTINAMCQIQQLCQLSNTALLQFQFTWHHKDLKDKISSKLSDNNRESAFLQYYQSKVNYLNPISTYGLNDSNDLLGMSMEINDVVIAPRGYGHPLEKSQVVFKDFMLQQLEEHYDFRV